MSELENTPAVETQTVPTHVLEIRITRMPKDVTPQMRLDKRIYAHTFNKAQKNTFGGLVKLLADGFGVDRKNQTQEQIDEPLQCIQVEGTKEFCEEARRGIEGIDDTKLEEFKTSPANQSFFQKIKDKVSITSEAMKDKGWTAFTQGLLLGGILITLDVSEIKKEPALIEKVGV